MNVAVSGRHVELTPAILRYVQSKLARTTRHFSRATEAHVILSARGIHQKAEVRVHVRGKDLYCECEEPDLYAAIDLLMDKLDRQLLKYKGKRRPKRA